MLQNVAAKREPAQLSLQLCTGVCVCVQDKPLNNLPSELAGDSRIVRTMFSVKYMEVTYTASRIRLVKKFT